MPVATARTSSCSQSASATPMQVVRRQQRQQDDGRVCRAHGWRGSLDFVVESMAPPMEHLAPLSSLLTVVLAGRRISPAYRGPVRSALFLGGSLLAASSAGRVARPYADGALALDSKHPDARRVAEQAGRARWATLAGTPATGSKQPQIIPLRQLRKHHLDQRRAHAQCACQLGTAHRSSACDKLQQSSNKHAPPRCQASGRTGRQPHQPRARSRAEAPR